MSVENQRRVRRIRQLAIPILIGLVVGVLVVVGLAAPGGPLGPAPSATAQPTTADLVRSRDDPILYGYGWVDQKNGIAHIPIQRAIDIVAQRGLPARPAGAQAAKDEGLTIPSYSSSGTQPEQVLH
jgi:hypothetical protein